MKTAVKSKPTKEQLKRDLNLDELPDDHFMELLERIGDSPYIEGPGVPGMLEEWTPEQIEAVVQDMFLAQSVSELLEEARKQSGLTMNDVAEKMSVSRGRINQLEHPDANLEVATVTRMAQAMGYKVTIMLEPESADKSPLKVEL
jgi:DNA-binding XRE family transcriptional regulator